MTMGKNAARDINTLLRFLIDEEPADSCHLRRAAGDLADRVQHVLGEGVTRGDLRRFTGFFGNSFGPLVAPHLTNETDQ